MIWESAIQENLSQTLVSIGLPNEISEIRASNFIKFMPNVTKLWYWNNNSTSSLESRCPNLTQNGSWNQKIWVPGHGDSIWEIKCKPSNIFPKRQELVQHEKEVKKFIRNCYLWFFFARILNLVQDRKPILFELNANNMCLLR